MRKRATNTCCVCCYYNTSNIMHCVVQWLVMHVYGLYYFRFCLEEKFDQEACSWLSRSYSSEERERERNTALGYAVIVYSSIQGASEKDIVHSDLQYTMEWSAGVSTMCCDYQVSANVEMRELKIFIIIHVVAFCCSFTRRFNLQWSVMVYACILLHNI